MEPVLLHEDRTVDDPKATRSLLVRNLTRNLKVESLREEFERFGPVQGINSRHLREEGFVVVDYFDLRDAGRASKGLSLVLSWANPNLCLLGTRLDVHYFTTTGQQGGPYENEGRVIVQNLPRDMSPTEFQTLLQYFGDLRRVTLYNKASDSSSWVVEYFDLRSSYEACSRLNRHVMDNRVLRATFLNGYTSWAVAGFAPPAPPPPPPPYQYTARRQSVDLPPSTFQEVQARRHSMVEVPGGNFFQDAQARRHSIDVPGGFQDGPSGGSKHRGAFPSPMSSNSHSRSPSPTRSLSPTLAAFESPPPPAHPGALHLILPSPGGASASSSATPKLAPSSAFPPSPPSSPPSQVYSSPPHHHGQHNAQLMQQQQQQQSPHAHHHSLHTPHHGVDSKHHPSRIPESFQIDLDNIKHGVDKRTTLMIRNIPNKYTQDMFLDFVNETHKGKYDFIYLPIDFKNKCNVGYSFINFIDPRNIATLFTRIQGKKWTRFNSEKICAVSYARIQGKENLIRHFQNSTIMSESTDYRPKIFHSAGPLMGTEEEFPEPNVMYKSSHFDHVLCCQDSQPKLNYQGERRKSESHHRTN